MPTAASGAAAPAAGAMPQINDGRLPGVGGGALSGSHPRRQSLTKPREQPQHARENQAHHQAARDREINPQARTLDSDISRQLAQERNRSAHVEKQSKNDEDQPDDDENATQRIHGPQG